MRGVLDKHVATLQQGARLVPEIDIAKPVVGAIKLVLDAYKKASEVREEMQTSFENLAEVFEEIDFSMRTYPKDQNIVVASTHLIRAIVVSVENAIEFYTSHQFVRAANATFSGSDYKKLLVQNLNDVKACCASLEKQSQRSFAHRVTNDSEYLKHQSARMIYQQHVSSTSLEQLVENSLRCNEGLADLKNIVLSLLSDRQNIVNVGPHSRVPSPSPSPVTPLLGPPREITSYLRIPRIDDEDMRDVVENSGFIMHGDNGKAQQLLENRLFSSWMSFQGSSKLLVHDNLEPPYDITSFSVVCTLLTHMLRRPGGTSISLVFFCGRHLAGDVYHGGSAMIRSLISQLLFQSGLYPFQYDSEYSVEDLERDDIEFLCDIFTWLIRRLPGNSNVFCIIDGISLYEQRFMQGMDAVVLALVELVEDDYDGRASLKLLITSPQPTYKVKKAFDSHPAELLDMEELPVVGDGLGLLGLGERLASDMEVRHDWMRNKGPR
ncbi:hypothetical protein CGCF415_v008467 [Colletotrichum fructicola]|uniref:Uncharacterized protein n=1 Tax=Colletotrichum fructicola (strain Nara gc5) TaxID=1213859 RepID=L2FU48_COLFN|nr:uncharacterized protein CGMCC3_g13757 [Colletotrichum fructicola]KAF4478250.1 hypothetical protein CGGC5_v014215 [Colletotrichum fructicola Nara gc5]KAE9570187.1 hypothetical protein CGMCC3_g13757 [Colletotrichum fructicola]KAF4888983.1 hypothetical protein CGCFRS4_v009585 [Colletotrichum fructicola]KAF4904927.1 hypothetical protein CGCF415_v008467 [Colletotrichum fructicola]KAF4933211.1 hypothetical protein CGCF245_v009879 [Colletotrichum fructicola]